MPSVLKESQKFNLLFREVRMPEVNYQNQSCLLSIVPGLVLKTIIEHIGFPLFLLTNLVPNSHAASTNSSYREMKAKLFISGSIVLHDV